MDKAGDVHAKYNTPGSKRQKPYFLLLCREYSYMYMYFGSVGVMKHTKGNMKGEAVLRKERQTEIKDQQNTCDRKTKGAT